MKQEPTKVQVLDALQTHKTVQKASKALGLSYPKMQHYLKKYGIVCNRYAKADEVIEVKQEKQERSTSIGRLFKRLFKKD